MFRADLLIVVPNWSQLRCPSTIKWLNKLWYVYTMEYDSAVRGNEPLTHVTTWMNLQEIMLSEKKPILKGCILCDSISITFLK